eukprot:TRINITY_DN1091_c0_g1_i1.p1 TRINITY_DN1091_c0_g1~~TRINITY_DN1091_c0_g1_i1.p1  ORF type:complete len:541 (+),score=-13.90 TRINITY_DN1091_c0_g1_i1:192-1814(+)
MELDADSLDSFIKKKSAIKIVVDVKIDDTILKISVGEGTQSFKWLAQAVMLRRGKKEANVISGFRNQNGELISPLDKIFEHSYKHQIKVTAECIPSIDIDEYGDPILSEWMQAAYIKSESSMQYFDELTAWRSKLNQTVTNEMENNNQTDAVSLVQIGELTEKDLDSAFSLDWSQMKLNNLSINTDNLKQLIRQIYHELSNIFIYYAGYGHVGHRYGMTMLDFGHFLHTSEIISCSTIAAVNNNYKAFEEIFMDIVGISNNSINNNNNQYPLMSRYEFIEGILQSIIYKQVMNKMKLKKEEEEENDYEDSYYSKTKSNTIEEILPTTNIGMITDDNILYLSEEFVNVIENNIIPYWDSILNSSLLYCNTDIQENYEIKEIVYHIYQIIKQAYLAYATIPKNNPLLGPVMSHKDVILILEECSILDSSNPDHMNYVTKVLTNLGTSFLSSKQGKADIDKLANSILNPEPIVPQITTSSVLIQKKVQVPVIQLDTISEICFSSFLDCVLRTAIISFDPKFDAVERIRLALNFITELQNYGRK